MLKYDMANLLFHSSILSAELLKCKDKVLQIFLRYLKVSIDFWIPFVQQQLLIFLKDFFE
jgi:hypothetical protein